MYNLEELSIKLLNNLDSDNYKQSNVDLIISKKF